MGVGKYSPTVSTSYMRSQEWWRSNGGGYGNGVDPQSDLDDDGYDSYGYSGEVGDCPDRAGYTEMDYMSSYEFDEDSDQLVHPLYDRVSGEWRGKLLGKLANLG